MPGRKVRAGAGVDWVGDGWHLFRPAKLMWIVILVLLFLVHLGLGMVPLVGMLLPNLVSPILMGGIMLGCRSLETGGELEIEHLLAGFRRNTGLLFAIGLVYAVGELAIMGLFGAVAGTSFVWAAMRRRGGHHQLPARGPPAPCPGRARGRRARRAASPSS